MTIKVLIIVSIVHAIYGGNVQIDTSRGYPNLIKVDSSAGTVYLGPSRGDEYPPTSLFERHQYGSTFNSNPNQQDHSGGRNVQIDTSENNKQYIGPRVAGQHPVLEGNYDDPPRVIVNGIDYTGQNVQRSGLHINQNPNRVDHQNEAHQI